MMEEGNSKRQEMEAKWKRLKILKDDLQESLEKSDIEVQDLMQELASLREENKTLQKEKAKFLDLMEEADRLKLSLEQCENTERRARQGEKELERRCLHMEEKAEELLHMISVSENENNLLRDDVTWLKQQIVELEGHLNTKSLELKEKDNQAQERELVIEEMRVTMSQYLSIKQVLNDKIQELQSQLEESYQEIAMRKAVEENSMIKNPSASTIMYEIIETRLEKQLEQERMKNDGIHGFLGWRFLLNMMQQFLWCSFSVGFFLLVFYVFMRLFHAVRPEYPLLNLRRIFLSETVDVLQNLLHPYLKLRVLGVKPS
ncbi:uncharacterized protein [Engystomops pustulosus]|uniref:uncharacterized protein n=1 Tax=Engystomops pustulosus TaxID=76066 RepID=UPI003AFA1668